MMERRRPWEFDPQARRTAAGQRVGTALHFLDEASVLLPREGDADDAVRASLAALIGQVRALSQDLVRVIGEAEGAGRRGGGGRTMT